MNRDLEPVPAQQEPEERAATEIELPAVILPETEDWRPAGLHDRFIASPAYLARVAQRIEAYGLQFASEARDEVTLPGFIGGTRLRWGAPMEEPS